MNLHSLSVKHVASVRVHSGTVKATLVTGRREQGPGLIGLGNFLPVVNLPFGYHSTVTCGTYFFNLLLVNQLVYKDGEIPKDVL